MEEDEVPSVNLIPCLKWVKQGVAKAHPDKVVLNEGELAEIIKRAKENVEDEINEINNMESPVATQSTTVDEYNFSNYDTEEAEPDVLLNIGNLAIYENQSDENSEAHLIHDDSDSEKEDDEIKSNDNLILVGHVEGDASILEVYVYNEDEGSLYVHHDFLLPSFPLCIEWLNFDPTDPNPGNLCAIGTMEPIIEIWDLDIIDCLESAYILGEKKKKKQKKKSSETLQTGHNDAVLALAWNQTFHHILASGSVDQTTLLWDLNAGKPSIVLNVFEEKVQALQWHPFEAHSLLTGCCDKKTRVFDCRENPSKKCLSWELESEIENVAWNTFEPYCYLVGTNEGYLHNIDCRSTTPVWSFKAHDEEITGLHVSSKCPGLLMTASNDGLICTWDLYNNNSTESYKSTSEPIRVALKAESVGAIQCLGECPNNPFTIAIGGDKKSKNFNVIDIRNIPSVNENFSQRKLVEMKIENESTIDT